MSAGAGPRLRSRGPAARQRARAGDKSITQRALIIGASARAGRVVEPLWAGDTEATAGMVAALGVARRRSRRSRAARRGARRGLRGLRAPGEPLDARNSGTAMRLLAGLLAGQRGRFVIDGDESLRSRPMDRVVAPLRAMGARIEARDGDFAPLAITGGELRGIKYSCRSPAPR